MVKKIRDSKKNEFEGLTEDMVVAQGIIFLTAGFETTSSTMSILIYMLAQYPNIQEKCYEEISALLSDEDKKIDNEPSPNCRILMPAFRKLFDSTRLSYETRDTVQRTPMSTAW